MQIHHWKSEDESLLTVMDLLLSENLQMYYNEQIQSNFKEDSGQREIGFVCLSAQLRRELGAAGGHLPLIFDK